MKDQAETGNYAETLQLIGSNLDNYLKFDHDDAQTNAHIWQQQLDTPLPQQGDGFDATVNQLITQVIANASAIPNPGSSGYITTGAVTIATLAATAANVASPQRYTLTAFNLLEEVSLNWLAEMLGIKGMKGVYSSGGSVANLVALGGAKQWAFEQVGHNAAADGINRVGVIYASAECHHTIQRSAGILGLGRNRVKSIKCDDKGCMNVEALEQAIKQDLANGILPIAIVANLGSTNTGAIDPIKPMGQISKKYKIWFHVDGAYGLPGILDQRISHLYEGLELADSIIIDPHKWLGASVGVAATFVKDRDVLFRAFTQEPADYLEGSVEQEDGAAPIIEHSLDDFGIPYYDFGVELSSPCRGVIVWAMIKEIGVDGMRARIMRHNDMAKSIAETAKNHPNLELMLEPTLSICCFRYISDKVNDLDLLNRRLLRRLVKENNYLPSTTQVNGKLAIRPCFIGARSEQSHADGLIKAVLRIGDDLADQL
ncbi:MAG: aminotransferase class V-fold PLP-dependent enzyme [Rhizobiales bacterium]|nr:aminotransferase class V-fold PLP-dependent enzyme [Hyphomicrobiales bacterium]NRB14058.1 aminotransferase class V-fold PLP-dependent enzyme [Hyphomicrobiales bacterium]